MAGTEPSDVGSSSTFNPERGVPELGDSVPCPTPEEEAAANGRVYERKFDWDEARRRVASGIQLTRDEAKFALDSIQAGRTAYLTALLQERLAPAEPAKDKP